MTVEDPATVGRAWGPEAVPGPLSQGSQVAESSTQGTRGHTDLPPAGLSAKVPFTGNFPAHCLRSRQESPVATHAGSQVDRATQRLVSQLHRGSGSSITLSSFSQLA